MSEETNDYKRGYIYAHDEIKREPEQVEYLEGMTWGGNSDFDRGINAAIRDLSTTS